MKLQSTSTFRLIAFLIATTAIEAVSIPGCQEYAPAQKNLTNVVAGNVTVGVDPFSIVYATREKDRAFVSINSGLAVLDTSTFVPSVVHKVGLPVADFNGGEGANDIALTRDGRFILIAVDYGIAVVDGALAINGSADAVVGFLNGTVGNETPGSAAIQVVVSLDGRYAFVAQEYGVGGVTGNTTGNIDVFRLSDSTANGTLEGEALGHLNLDYAVPGIALSPDGRYLYAVSEDLTLETLQGGLSVIDVRSLTENPSNATILATVDAGCNPVRVLPSSDGRVVWVTARTSNYLLAFDVEKLLCDPDDALLAAVQVGDAPVDLIFYDNERRLLTVDSARYQYSNDLTGLTIVDVEAALNGSTEAVLGRVPAGGFYSFPREATLSPDQSTILVTLWNASTVMALDVATLP